MMVTVDKTNRRLRGSGARKTSPAIPAIGLLDERNAFKQFAGQGRLAAAIYFFWSGSPGDRENKGAVFRCNALTDAGKLALSPL
ncbi:MAG: hypothetical protein ABI192_11550 [Bradyrhizobium sp.]